MDGQVLASFTDEFMKIAANVAVAGMGPSAISKPTPIPSGSSVQSALKPMSKGTNYTAVHTTPPVANTVAGASKVTLPPPVRT